MTTLLGASLFALAVAACGGPADGPMPEVEASAPSHPLFELDPDWPALPNDWVTGEVSSVTVDRRDHIWVLHRPHTVPEENRDNAAPPIIEFDDTGAFVNAWGGQAEGYDWPWNEHGLFADHDGHIWIGGNNPTGRTPPSEVEDNMLLKFTNTGELLLQIGGRDLGTGNLTTDSVRKSAEMFVYEPTNEVFVADGYGNRRVIVFDADTGSSSACGPPSARSRATRSRRPTRTTRTARPGSARCMPSRYRTTGSSTWATATNSRIQVFDLEGNYQRQVFVNQFEGRSLTCAGIGVLAGPGAAVHVRGRPGQPARARARPPDARGARFVGRAGPGPGRLRRAAPPGGRQQGQPLYGGGPAQHRAQRFLYAGMSQ